MSGLKEIRLGAASDDDQGQLIYSYTSPENKGCSQFASLVINRKF